MGIHIRDCTGSYNNLAPRNIKVSAIDVTVKALFERLYLVPGLHKFVPFVIMPLTPTSPPLALWLFLDFRAIFFSNRPSIFFVSTIRQVIWPSPGTLGFPHLVLKAEIMGGVVIFK